MNFDDLLNYFTKVARDENTRLSSQDTEEICSFLDQHVEKLDDYNVFNAYCLLVQIAVCGRDNIESVRIGVETLYIPLALNSATSVLEFYRLGEAIAVVTRLRGEQGSESLHGCRLTLPFCKRDVLDITKSHEEDPGINKYSNIDNSSRSSGHKVTINISSTSHLFAIQRFWCNVLTKISSTKKNVSIDFSIPRCLPALSTMFSFLHCLDTAATTVTSLCLVVTTILKVEIDSNLSPSIPKPLRVTIALNVLEWLSGRHPSLKIC